MNFEEDKPMAVTKKIEIDGKQVEFKASAAIPRIYRNRFGRDVYKDLMALNDAIKDQDEEASMLDGFSLEMFEDLSFVMYCAAHPDEKYDSPDEWLDQFDTFSIYQILPELIDLWGMNIKTTVPERKN
jgi:hypothetical protein